MSIENFSPGQMREGDGLTKSDFDRFKALFGKIRRGVARKELVVFWEFLKDKTDGQLEALSAAYISSLPEKERQEANLPETFENLKRMSHALDVVMKKSQESVVRPVEVPNVKTAPEPNSGQKLAQQLNRQLTRKATDEKELRMAVDDPEAFWKMMESL